MLYQNRSEKMMVFVNTCASVDFYGKIIKNFKFLDSNTIYDIHGQMKQKKRNKMIETFRLLKSGVSLIKGVLICTDVVARGIDFDDVKFILQIDPP